MAFNVNDYNSYNNEYFKNPYSFKGKSLSPELTSLFSGGYAQQGKENLPKASRSTLDRSLDLLMTPVYTVAGFGDGLAQQWFNTNDSVQWYTPYTQAWDGFKAGINFFGQGDEHSEYTFGKVLGTAGWNPESTIGKIAKGTIGFGLDVALDPTTYLTGGASAIFKGTGKTGKTAEAIAKVADELPKMQYDNTVSRLVAKGATQESAEKFAYQEFWKSADKFKGATHMTDDMARVVVERQAMERGYEVTGKQLDKDATALANQYNKMLGIREIDGKGKGITFGVENFPFVGQKLAPKMGWFGKTRTISDGASARALADKLKLTNAYSGIRNTIYGKKIGELFSTTTPLYRLAHQNPAKLYEYMKFMDYTKGLNVDKIAKEQEIANMAKAMNFTPAESKEVIKLLEDKTVWSKVKNTLNFAETAKAREIATATANAIPELRRELDELTESTKSVENMRYMAEKNLIQDKDTLKVMENTYREELTKIDLKHVNDAEEMKHITDSIQDEIKRVDEELLAFKNTNGVDREELVKLSELAKVELDEVGKYNSLKNTLRNNKRKSSDLASQTRQELDSVVNRAVDDELLKMNVQAPVQQHHQNLLKQLSQFVYGRNDVINPALKGKALDDLVRMIDDGSDAETIAMHIERNAEKYSEHATEVNRYLASKHGYKDFKEDVAEPLKKYQIRLSRNEALSPTEQQDMLRLLQKKALKEADHEKYFKDMTLDQFMKHRTDEAHAKLLKEVEDEIDLDLDARRKTFIDNDSAQRDAIYTADDPRFYQAQRNVDRRYADQSEFAMDGRLVRSLSEIDNTDEATLMFQDAMMNYVNSQSKLAGKNLTDKRNNLINPTSLETIYKMSDSMEHILKTRYKGKAYSDLTKAQKSDLMKASVNKQFAKPTKISTKEQKALVDEVEKRALQAKMDYLSHKVEPGMRVSFTEGKGRRSGIVQSREFDIGTDAVPGRGTIFKVEADGKVYDVPVMAVRNVRTLDKKVMTPDELVQSSPVAKDIIKQKEDLVKLLDEEMANIGRIDSKYNADKAELYNFFKVRADEQRKLISELEDSHRLYNDTLESMTESGRADELASKIARYEDALKNDDALELFVRSTKGDDYVAGILESENITNSAKIALSDMSESDKVKRWVETLREEFYRMGEAEVGIKKLSQEQFDAMIQRYVPHILTVDGKRYIDSVKELKPHKASLTQDLGYGQKWNPFAKSRTIEDKTIEEANAFFAEKLKGKNLFADNISDIYITRAMKHNELIYDNRYMSTMMDVFGKPLAKDGTVEEGYKAVVNYGQLKELVGTITKNKVATFKQSGQEVNEAVWDKLTKESINSLGLPKGILDDFATPMVELSKEQISKINPHGIVKQVNDAIVGKANQTRKLAIARDQNRYLKVYDKFLHWTKLMQTTVMPSFHVRNKMSNAFNNWLGVGQDAVNPKMQATAWKVAIAQGDPEKLKHLRPLDIIRPDGTPDVIHWSDVYRMAKENGAIDEGFFAKDVGAGTASKGLIKKLPPKFDPTDSENFILFKKGAEVGSKIENSDRLIHFASELKRGKTVEEATESSKKFLFDYSDLTAFEQNVMKRIFPYYTWMRKNGRLQASQILEQPGKYRDTAKVMEAINSSNSEEDRVQDIYMSDFARDWIQTPFSSKIYDEQGNVVGKKPIMLNPNLPFMDFARMPQLLPGEVGNSARELLSQTAPLIKNPLELATNKNFFFNDEIQKEGEDPVTPRLQHLARQLALYNAGEGVATKEGVNGGLHALNTLTGVKGLAYDYDMSKRMAIVDSIEKGNKGSGVIEKALKSVGEGVVGFVKGGVEVAGNKLKDNVVKLVGQPPESAKDYEGALRPISQTTYEKLSDAEKKLYTAPTKEDAVAYNKEAMSLEKKALEETGKAKKFVWTLLDKFEKEPTKFTVGNVTKVTDGDTFEVRVGDSTEKVRILLVDTPESAGEYAENPMPFGKEASQFSQNMLFGKDVKLHITEKDKYGRTLAYVEVDGKDFNKALLDEGLGQVRYLFDSKSDKVDEYYKAEEEAHKKKKGLWSVDGYAEPGDDGGYSFDAIKRFLAK